MSDELMITILKESIPLSVGRSSIDELKYFEENPRVYSAIRGEEGLPTDGDEDKLQEIIEKKMLEQPSVKNLISNIQSHGGLNEPILVRHDTKRVIEGNSRLTVFRHLYKKTGEEIWATIPCYYVSKLTEKQQDAYLSQIHLKGKTPWTAYEKANICYVRKQNGISIEEISVRLSETPNEIRKRIETIDLMQNNKDKEMSHFSYYDVLVRSRKITGHSNYNDGVKEVVLLKIRDMKGEYGPEGDSDRFKAEELRDKFPFVLDKKKELNKFLDGRVPLDEAYQNSRPSDPHQKVKAAREKVKSILKREISCLETNEINDLALSVKRLVSDVDRLKRMVETVEKEKNAK